MRSWYCATVALYTRSTVGARTGYGATKLDEVSYTPSKLHDTRSVSKSVVSLLVGIAIDRKLIASVDERVFNYFPEYADVKTPEKDAITLRHLLTMSAGLRANESVDMKSPAKPSGKCIRPLTPTGLF